MRKTIFPPVSVPGPEPAWLDLERLARVEVSSEDPAPQLLQRIRIHFDESQHERRQEFALRWSADGTTSREIVRQQWNFSPSGSTREAENYVVVLAGVSVLELYIVPDTSGGDAHASLAELRIA